MKKKMKIIAGTESAKPLADRGADKALDAPTDFPCTICGTRDKWKNVDEFRLNKAGMCLCGTCGFITYPARCVKTDEMNEHYRGHDYREAPTVSNLFAGERKLHYHGVFLKELFEEWREKGIANPKVLEIGAALGMVLTWVRSQFPKAVLTGTELTLSFRRNAWWMYKVLLDEKADFTEKRDLIISYKVAEHIPFVDVELRKYAETLTENGRLYVSVPTWFNELNNPGLHGFDLGFYYDPNHVNVWSQNLFEQLLKKCGLEVVKENHTYYGDTYLCKRNDALMKEPLSFDDVPTRLDELARVFQAGKLSIEGKWAEAVKVWPNFPEANQNVYEMVRSKVHQMGFEGIERDYIKTALKNCPNSAAVSNFAADIYMRYERFQEALDILQHTIELRPNDPPALIASGHCLRQLSVRQENPEDAEKLLHEARRLMGHLEKISKQCAHEAITWVMQDNARLPLPNEKIANPVAVT